MIESLVSVVVPCFNHGATLRRAVASALAQKYLHEIIVIDDCSSDDSMAVADALLDLDPRIAVFRMPANGGPAKARNFGSMYATGHYLSFLDADDEYSACFLQLAVDAMEASDALGASSQLEAVKLGVEFVDEVGRSLFETGDPRLDALIFSVSSNIVLTTELYRKIGGFPEDKIFRGGHGGEDVAFNTALAKFADPLGRIDTAAYRCWSRPGSHLDKFIRNTVVDGESFHFKELSADQQPGGALETAIEAYLDKVGQKLERLANEKL